MNQNNEINKVFEKLPKIHFITLGDGTKGVSFTLKEWHQLKSELMQGKKCNKCGKTKPISEFYPIKDCKFGVRGTCKECYKEHYDEERRKNPDKNRERQRKYDRSEKGRIHHRKNSKEQRKKFRLEHLARVKLGYALKKGIIKKPTVCSKCGNEGRIEGHHKDFNKPLEVEWLCNRCHKLEHGRVIL